MKYALIAALLSISLLGTTFGAAKGPEIRIVDNKVSIQAEAVPLSRLLRLLDQATGMTSKVPPELANRNVSVRFSDLKLDDAYPGPHKVRRRRMPMGATRKHLPHWKNGCAKTRVALRTRWALLRMRRALPVL